jgi:aminoglycoside phosphotransferase (APT) family kinase protein
MLSARELATSGDPMADLGWLASTWQDPGERLPPTTAGPSTVVGFPVREPGAAARSVVLAEAARDALRGGPLRSETTASRRELAAVSIRHNETTGTVAAFRAAAADIAPTDKE